MEINNKSGHFKLGPGSIESAKKTFGEIPKDYFSKEFKGFKAYGE